jgi:hypothetical protein
VAREGYVLWREEVEGLLSFAQLMVAAKEEGRIECQRKDVATC